ncbi:hypothetical protein K439DRAFT_1366825, partial [Ramaria rubella]
RHVYGCVEKELQANYRFGEFCFLCNSWFASLLEWTNRCQSHLDGKGQLPTQAYDKSIASPGYCPFCLGDKRKDAADRDAPLYRAQGLV